MKALKYVLGFLGYMAAWAPIILVTLMTLEKLLPGNQGAIAIAILIYLFVIIIGMVPFMQWLAKKVFVYPGEGEPVSEAQLREKIMDINNYDVPVMVKQKKKKLIVTWNYVNAKWYGIISKAGMDQVYELIIKFDDAKKTATLIDVHKKVSWGVDTGSAKLAASFFRGIDLSYERGIAYGIKDGFELGKIYDYKFTTSEIKDPVMNTILGSGWQVRFGMW